MEIAQIAKQMEMIKGYALSRDSRSIMLSYSGKRKIHIQGNTY